MKDDLPPAAIRQRLQGFVRERIVEFTSAAVYGLAYPELPAIVTRFETKPLAEIPLKHGLYGGINLTDEIALIHLELSQQPAPAHHAARRARRRSAARPRL